MSLNLDKSEWTRVAFGTVAQASKEKVDPLKGSVERYVAGEHMDTDDLKIHRWGEVGDGYLGPAFHRRFRPGQVLYGSRRTYLRKVALADFDGVCANTTFVVETKDSGRLSPEFLPFIMTSEPFHAFAIAESKGSVNPYVNWSDIERYQFDLPPVDEQKRIADLLWAVEADQRAAATSAACVEDVIGEFCSSVFLSARDRYPAASFEAGGDLLMGRQKAPKYARGVAPKPYLRVANIGALALRLDVIEEMDFEERDFARYRLKAGDVLLTEGDIVSALNVGRPAIFDGSIDDCCFQNTLIRFRPRDGSDSHFYCALFEGMRRSGVFAGAASTTTVTHLGIGRLSAVPLPAVPTEDQAAIGDQLRSLLSLRTTAAARLRTTGLLKAAVTADVHGGVA